MVWQSKHHNWFIFPGKRWGAWSLLIPCWSGQTGESTSLQMVFCGQGKRHPLERRKIWKDTALCIREKLWFTFAKETVQGSLLGISPQRIVTEFCQGLWHPVTLGSHCWSGAHMSQPLGYLLSIATLAWCLRYNPAPCLVTCGTPRPRLLRPQAPLGPSKG